MKPDRYRMNREPSIQTRADLEQKENAKRMQMKSRMKNGGRRVMCTVNECNYALGNITATMKMKRRGLDEPLEIEMSESEDECYNKRA